MIRFACPICRVVIKAPPQAAGIVTTCPSCRQRLRVPTMPMAEPVDPPDQFNFSPDQPTHEDFAAEREHSRSTLSGRLAGFALGLSVFLGAISGLVGVAMRGDRMHGRGASWGTDASMLVDLLSISWLAFVLATLAIVITSFCMWDKHTTTGRVLTIAAAVLMIPCSLCGMALQ